MEYNEYFGFYTVIGRKRPAPRLKRDGRNPSTGAFTGNTRSGSVTLVKDYPIRKDTVELTLPDSSGYAGLRPEHVNSISGFNDKVHFEIVPFLELTPLGYWAIETVYGGGIGSEFPFIDGPYAYDAETMDNFRLLLDGGRRCEYFTGVEWLIVDNLYIDTTGKVWLNGFKPENNVPVFNIETRYTMDISGYEAS